MKDEALIDAIFTHISAIGLCVHSDHRYYRRSPRLCMPVRGDTAAGTEMRRIRAEVPAGDVMTGTEM